MLVWERAVAVMKWWLVLSSDFGLRLSISKRRISFLAKGDPVGEHGGMLFDVSKMEWMLLLERGSEGGYL